MNHLETYQFEVYVPKSERDWLSWAGTVESMLGHTLDGDLSEDGYSLDRAYDHFKLGTKTTEYVKEVRGMSQYKDLGYKSQLKK